VIKYSNYSINDNSNNSNSLLDYLEHSANLYIHYILNESDLESFQKLIKNEVKCNNLTIDPRVIKTIDICKAKDKSCSKCNSKIGNLDYQYYCYSCNIYYCFACGGNYNIYNEGLKILPHQHNLIFIKTKHESRQMKKIDLSRIEYYQTYKFENLNQIHRLNCITCRKTIEGIRYLCLSCPATYNNISIEDDRTINFCSKCFDIQDNLIHIKFNKNKQILESKHDPKTHIYMVLYFSNEEGEED